MIISASRRTDIPAFYTPWFMKRIRSEFLLVRNPFNAHQITRVSLNPLDVEVIAFWTRNPRTLMSFLPELDRRGHRYYFQYTITGYPRTLEGSVPKTQLAIDTFCQLSDLIGAEKVVWRYDPILISNQVTADEHKRLFSKISGLIAGKTSRVVISFADFYEKTERNLKRVPDLEYQDLLADVDQLMDLSMFMAKTAQRNGMRISSCAERIDITEAGIPHGKCIDDSLIKEVFGFVLPSKKDKGQRDECGCIKSVDIGSYNTCLHECTYCYATYSKNTVIKNKKKHDPDSPFLIGGTEGVEQTLLEPGDIQGRLF